MTSFEDTKITGTVTAKEDSLFFTSIPYDKGWKVKIDGKEIAEKDYIALEDAYLCFNIPAGNHSIELEFEQRGFVIGIAISATTVVLMILVAILFAKLRKEREERLYREEINQIVDELLEEVDRQLAEEATAANGETDNLIEIENIAEDGETPSSEEESDSDESPETEESEENADCDTEESDEDFTDEA